MKPQYASRAEELFARLKANGELEIDQLIADAQLEAYFLDFKTAEKHGGPSLGNDDRKILAKALSGFSNSEGGVMLWGVSTAKGTDVADAKKPLANPARFASQILAAVSALTMPPAEGVDALHIPHTGDSGTGYVAVWIPKGTRGPLQVLAEGKYYIRVGNSFQPAPHAVLAGMFGRAPQPEVTLHFASVPARPYLRHEKLTAYFRVQFLLSNRGPVVAEGLYATMHLTSLAGGEVEAPLRAPSNSGNAWREGLEEPDEYRWVRSNGTTDDLSVVAAPDYRIAPRGRAQAFLLDLWFSPTPAADFAFELVYGCNGAPPTVRSHRVERSRLAELVQEVLDLQGAPEATTIEKGHRLAAQLLGLHPDDEAFRGVLR